MDLLEPSDLLQRLRAQPGGEQLLAAAPAGAYLVGGAVRDLLQGRTPRELDVVLTGVALAPAAEVTALAQELAALLGSEAGMSELQPSTHARFGTASVRWNGGRIDLAAARRERYPAPGALPEVEQAPLEEDLLRRDFTLNAIALELDGERPGELRAAPTALEDLSAGRLRVLHERSFLDDPTRLLRLARYRVRLGFAVEQQTAALAAAAVAAGALGSISGARVGAELRLALAEPDPTATLAELDRLGVLSALHPRLRFEQGLALRALELLAEDRSGDGRPALLLLAVLTLPLALRADAEPGAEIAALLDRLEFPAGERERVVAAAVAVPALVEGLAAADSASALYELARHIPLEGVALAGALEATGTTNAGGEAVVVEPPARRAARLWLQELRHVHLRISGEDLLAAGIAQGPELGRRLDAALRLRLDGELPDEREAQLQAALQM